MKLTIAVMPGEEKRVGSGPGTPSRLALPLQLTAVDGSDLLEGLEAGWHNELDRPYRRSEAMS
jgi:hypothetical protein